MPDSVKTTIYWALGVGVIALILLVLAILFGNLSGNVGFAASTQGYNDTQAIIQNYTKSATNTSTQFPVVGTIIGVALLLTILIGVLVLAIKKMMGVANTAGGSNANFG